MSLKGRRARRVELPQSRESQENRGAVPLTVGRARLPKGEDRAVLILKRFPILCR
jgi:hypothetical protein